MALELYNEFERLVGLYAEEFPWKVGEILKNTKEGKTVIRAIAVELEEEKDAN